MAKKKERKENRLKPYYKYRVNELVLAKINGFAPWPAKVSFCFVLFYLITNL